MSAYFTYHRSKVGAISNWAVRARAPVGSITGKAIIYTPLYAPFISQ